MFSKFLFLLRIKIYQERRVTDRKEWAFQTNDENLFIFHKHFNIVTCCTFQNHLNKKFPHITRTLIFFNELKPV